MSLTTLRSNQAAANATVAGLLAALFAWVGPPGTDFAAHAFQLDLFLRHGFELWSNDWYAGRYSFVGYSLLYYPLASIVGIRLLAVLSVAGASAAFTLLTWRAWGSSSLWANRTFALVAAASMLTAAFPYGLGLALALAALLALARRRLLLFAALGALAFAASPLAFLFALVAAAAASGSRSRSELAPVAAAAAAICAIGIVVWRLFPDPGHFPFQTSEFIGVICFCLAGAVLSWRVAEALILRRFFLIYAALCLLAYAIPSNLGGNAARLRLAAVPIAVLLLSLRRWRPRWVSIVALALVLAWNVSPLAYSLVRGTSDPSTARAYWRPVIGFLHRSLTPSYRVEVVATADHWEAAYLPEAGIPIVRGWFRQDDFPQNGVLYGRLTRGSYLAWLHQLGVRYVVLTDAPLDYSAKNEAMLLRSGAAGLPIVARLSDALVFSVPAPTSIVSGPGHPRIERSTEEAITLILTRPGRYRIAVRYSPYFVTAAGCLSERRDGMTELAARRAGAAQIAFRPSFSGALAALSGSSRACSTAR